MGILTRKNKDILSIPVVVISGETASGKSSLALELCQKFNGSIINGDSRQIYKELSIGTDKPNFEEASDSIGYIDSIPHYLYDFVSINQEYDLARYQKDAFKCIQEIYNGGRIPFIVGGTGLYIDAVVENFKLSDPKDTRVEREKLLKLTVEELTDMIPGKTIRELNDSDRNNPRRLVRIIEKGNRISEKNPPLHSLYLVKKAEDTDIDVRIKNRIDEMFELGLEQEVGNLKGHLESDSLKALDTIGYQEFRDYYSEQITMEELKENILIHSRQYAKRQRTWFNRKENVKFVCNMKEASNLIQNFLTDSKPSDVE